MNEILHANVFFVIASIATVIFCVLISVALYHVIKILRSVRSIFERIEAGSEAIAQDVAQLRAAVANGGFISRLFQFIMGTMGGGRRRKRRAHKED